MSYPTGIATDTKGDIWVTDAGDNRVERWVAGHFYATSTTAPTYARSFGSYGTTAGHQDGPTGVAIDPSGRIWVTDWLNDTLQRYNSKGEYEATFGGPGKEAGSSNSRWAGDLGRPRLGPRRWEESNT